MVQAARVKAQGMYTLQNFRRVVTATCAAMFLGSIALPVVAQTAEQMKVFQSLPPDQQQEILQKIGEQKGIEQAPVSAPALPTSIPKTDVTTEQLVDALETAPRLRAGDTVLLTVDIPAEIDRARSEYRSRILDGNPYKLDRMGRLVLQDSAAIVLAGLTAGEAAVRLNADPQLRGYTFGVRLLPVEPEKMIAPGEMPSKYCVPFPLIHRFPCRE